MKKNLYVLLLFITAGIMACSSSSDDDPNPAPMPEEEETELSSNSHLMMFNALKERMEIEITIDQTQSNVTLNRGSLSDYIPLTEGTIEVQVKEVASGDVLLTKNLELEGGYFYSSLFFKNLEGDYDIYLSQDYDETQRNARNGSTSVNFVAVNLSKNVPFETMSVFNLSYNRSTPNGDIGDGTVRAWINNLAYGQSQKTDQAEFGNIANQLLFVSGDAETSAFENEELLIPISALNGVTVTTNVGINGTGPIGRFTNTRIFLSNKTYLFVAFDHHTDEGRVDGVVLDLNSIRIGQ